MKLRKKFFAVLVIFSLLPLGGVVWVGRREIGRLEAEISADTRRQVLTLWRQMLRLSTEDSAAIIQMSKRSFEFALAALAREAETLLGEEPPARTELFFASDFDDPFRRPPESQWRPAVAEAWDSGESRGYWLSHRRPAVLLAPGLAAESVRGEIDRLSGLQEAFVELAQRLGLLLHAAFAVTESGVQIVFPGRGGFPEGYDPLGRAGVREASGEPRWIGPVVEAGSHRRLLTVLQRVFPPGGGPETVVGLEVLLSEVLRSEELATLWRSESVSSFLVEAIAAGDGRAEEILVFARAERDGRGIRWDELPVPEPLGEADPEGVRRLSEAIRERRSGLLEMNFRGEPCLWAHASVHEGLAFLVAVPLAVVAQLPERAAAAIASFTRQETWIVGAVAIGAVLVAVAAAWIGARRFARPMATLAEAAAALSRGRFDVRIDLRTGDERDRVIEAFNVMVPKLEEHLRMRTGLLLASEVQQKLLPHRAPVWPGLEVSGVSLPCDETGGDYYDFFEDATGTPCIAVADVSGHGIPAALLMATARATLRMRALAAGGGAAMLGDVNRRLAEDFGESGAFMTMFFVNVDAERRILRWVRAGHAPALLFDPFSGRFQELRGVGVPLGVDPQAVFVESSSGPLPAGSLLFIGTDGLWETAGPGGEFFGPLRLRELIARHGRAPVSVLVQAVVRELERFAAGRRFADDVTMVALRLL